MAERVGFEPTDPVKGQRFSRTVPIDHSGTSPHRAAKCTLARELTQRPLPTAGARPVES